MVVAALRTAKEAVIVHDDVFPDDAPDVEWLSEVGKRGWVVLTKDARIRTNALERAALLDANVAAFMLGAVTSADPRWRKRLSLQFHG